MNNLAYTRSTRRSNAQAVLCTSDEHNTVADSHDIMILLERAEFWLMIELSVVCGCRKE